MRQAFLAVLILAFSAACFAQSGKPYQSLGGFGNILYPGTGHAPNVNPNPPSGYNWNRGGYGNGGHRGGYGGGHPAHGQTTIVPYPVFIGGGYGGYYGGGPDPSQQQYQQEAPPPLNSYGAPSVVINQTFIPDHATPAMREYPDNGADTAPAPEPSGLRVYEGPKTPVVAAKNDDVPTLYLIAFKDHTIVQALGYWMENGAFHYVSAEHTVNQVSTDLIDRDLTQRLNDERNVEFKFPK